MTQFKIAALGLFLMQSAYAAPVILQADVAYRLDGDVKPPRSQSKSELKKEFQKHLDVFCAKSGARPQVKSLELSPTRRNVYKDCPKNESGGYTSDCSDDALIPTTYIRAKASAEVECIPTEGVSTDVDLHSSTAVSAQSALNDTFSGNYLMNISHSYGCGKHYFFVSQKMACSEVEVPAHQNFKLQETDTCVKVLFYTDNNCEAGSVRTLELDPSRFKSPEASYWDRVVLVNGKNIPFLVNGFMGELELLPAWPQN